MRARVSKVAKGQARCARAEEGGVAGASSATYLWPCLVKVDAYSGVQLRLRIILDFEVGSGAVGEKRAIARLKLDAVRVKVDRLLVIGLLEGGVPLLLPLVRGAHRVCVAPGRGWRARTGWADGSPRSRARSRSRSRSRAGCGVPSGALLGRAGGRCRQAVGRSARQAGGRLRRRRVLGVAMRGAGMIGRAARRLENLG